MMDTEDIFQKISLISEQLDATIYVVGGYVRDQLLFKKYGTDYKQRFSVTERNAIQPVLEQDIAEGEKPEPVIIEPEIKEDIDFVVEGSGLKFAKKFDEKYDIGSLVTFEDFDTARYVIDSDLKYEIEFAGARTEDYDSDSRKPEVESASLEEDLNRRDFTVNAMARKLTEEGLGEVIDPLGGREDIRGEILKTPHDPDQTFEEDPLRMLRAVRFAAKLDFEIENDTLQSIKENRSRLEIVSVERIRDEFLKLLSTPKPSKGLWILHNTKLINEFLPEVSNLSRKEKKEGISHKDNLAHTFEVVDNITNRTNKPLLVFAALMHDIGKPETKQFDHERGWTFDMHEHVGKKIVHEVGQRLNMSKKNIEYVAELVRWHQQPVQLIMDQDNITDSAVRKLIVELEEKLDDLLKLGRSDITTGSPDREQKYLENYDKLESKIIEVIQRDKLREFQSPVDGNEIMEICDLEPGPTVGKIKKDIEEAILEGEIPNDYKAAKEYLKEIKSDYLQQAKEWELKN